MPYPRPNVAPLKTMKAPLRGFGLGDLDEDFNPRRPPPVRARGFEAEPPPPEQGAVKKYNFTDNTTGKNYEMPWENLYEPTEADFEDFIERAKHPSIGDRIGSFAQGATDIATSMYDQVNQAGKTAAERLKAGNYPGAFGAIAEPLTKPFSGTGEMMAAPPIPQDVAKKTARQQVGGVFGLPMEQFEDAYAKSDYARMAGQTASAALLGYVGYRMGRGKRPGDIPDIGVNETQLGPVQDISAPQTPYPTGVPESSALPIKNVPETPHPPYQSGRYGLTTRNWAESNPLLAAVPERLRPPSPVEQQFDALLPSSIRDAVMGDVVTPPSKPTGQFGKPAAKKATSKKTAAPKNNPFDKMSDNDVKSFAEAGDKGARAEAGRRPSLKRLFKSEKGAIGDLSEGPDTVAENARRKGEDPRDYTGIGVTPKRSFGKIFENKSVVRTQLDDFKKADNSSPGERLPPTDSFERQMNDVPKPKTEKKDFHTSFVDSMKRVIKGEEGELNTQPLKDIYTKAKAKLGATTSKYGYFGEYAADITKANISVIKDSGTGGKILAENLLRSRNEGDMRAGTANVKLKSYTEGFTPEEIKSYIGVLDKGEQPMNSRVKAAANKGSLVLEDLENQAAKVGLGFKMKGKQIPVKGSSSWPRIFPSGFFANTEAATKAIVDAGYAPDMAKKILHNARLHTERLIDPKTGKEISVEGYRKDLAAQYQYVNDLSKKIQQQADFGRLNDKKSAISRMIAATDQPARVKRMVEKHFGETEPMNPAWAKGNNTIAKFEAATKLGSFILSNVSNIGMVPLKATNKAFRQAIWETARDYKGSKIEAEGTGALQAIYSDMLQDINSRGLAHWYGIEGSETLMRTISAKAGTKTAVDLFERVKSNPADKKSAARLRDLIQEDVVKQNSLTEAQINRAGARMSELTQGRASNLDLPNTWSDHPAARMIFMFKRYAHVQSRNMWDSFKTDPVRTAAVVGGLFTILGEGVGDAKAAIQGATKALLSGEDVSDEVEKKLSARSEGVLEQKMGKAYRPLQRVFNNLSQAWAFGLAGEAIGAFTKGRNAFLSFAGGPVLGDIDRIGGHLGTGDTSGLGRDVVRSVPMFGSGAAEAAFPPRRAGRRNSRGRSRGGR